MRIAGPPVGERPGRFAADDLVEEQPIPARSAARDTMAPLSTHTPARDVALEEHRHALVGDAVMVGAAASSNQRRQPWRPSAGSSEESGNDVTTLAPASVPAARSHGSASPW